MLFCMKTFPPHIDRKIKTFCDPADYLTLIFPGFVTAQTNSFA